MYMDGVKIRILLFFSSTMDLDKHPESKLFLQKVKQIGFNVVTKEVKYIPVSIDSSHFKVLAREVKDSLNSMRNLGNQEGYF